MGIPGGGVGVGTSFNVSGLVADGSADASAAPFGAADPLVVLCAELAKQLVCNLCGIFSPHEQATIHTPPPHSSPH